MDEVKVKRRRTSTKHSQTGCKTCKTRHIKCDETQPRCLNCEKGDRTCVYTKSPKNNASPLPPESAPSSVPYFTQPFTFRPAPTHAPVFHSPTNTTQRLPYEDIFSTSHPFEPAASFGSQRSNTPKSGSITPSPRIRHPTTSTALVRNAVLVNNVQSQVQIRQAIHSFSKDFRLRGQLFTVESVLSPLIYRIAALKHAVYANFILQAEQAKSSPSSQPSSQELAALHVRHYNTAINHLQTTLNNQEYADTNVGTCLILAFYDLCAGDLEHYTTHIRTASEQIRVRGATLETKPLPLHTKFLFNLYMRTDTVASNAVGQPSNVDPEIARIVYHGVPISNKSLLPYRIELELILADISHFQYEINNILPPDRTWTDLHQEAIFRQRYQDLLARLHGWRGRDPELLVFEEASGEYPHGSMLPPEMGLPLLCNDQELAQMWCLHCTATIHLHLIAARHHVIAHVPVESRGAAILCGGILSGCSIVDPVEPSVTAIWPLINMSYALDFAAGKIWVADQLESIAKRYLTRNARIVAEKVRETMLSEEPNLDFITAMRTDPPSLGGRRKLVVPDQQSWGEPPLSEPDLFQTFLHEERRTSSSVSMRDPSGFKLEEDIYGNDPRDWEHRLQ